MFERLAVVQNRIGIGGRSKVLAESIRSLSGPNTHVGVHTLSSKADFERFVKHYNLYRPQVCHRRHGRFFPRYLGTIYEQLFTAYLCRDDLETYDFVFNSNNALRFLPESTRCLNYVHQPIPAVPDITKRYHNSPLLQGYALPIRLLQALSDPPDLTEHPTVTNSHFVAEHFEESFGRPPEAVVYPPCIDAVDCTPIGSDGVVSLGSFHPNKRQLFQIEVAECLPDTEFTIIGRTKSEDYYEQCKDAVRDRGLNNVELVPNASSETVETELNENRFFLHSMAFEEFGISVVEAMNHGCIPVIHASGGPTETVPDESVWFESRAECVDAIRTYKDTEPSFRSKCTEHLKSFTTEHFREQIQGLVETNA